MLNDYSVASFCLLKIDNPVRLRNRGYRKTGAVASLISVLLQEHYTKSITKSNETMYKQSFDRELFVGGFR